MTSRYSIPGYLFNQVIQVALNKPDPIHMDAMGQDPDATMAAWKANLSLMVDMVAVHAWAAGCQWAVEQQPLRVVVTTEQFDELAKKADDGEQAKDPRD